jgi:hypothetical protein
MNSMDDRLLRLDEAAAILGLRVATPVGRLGRVESEAQVTR